MGFFGTLGRHAGRAALRGTGQLVAVVVPDHMSPWDLRKKSANTTASLFSAARRTLSKKKKKKKPTGSRKSSTRPTRASTAVPSAFLPWSGWPGLPTLSLASIGLRKKPKPSTKKTSQVRPSTTKGLVNLSRRSASTASPVIVIHAPVPDAPRFNKNAWARGGGLSSSTDWDTPSPTRWKPASRLKRAGKRKKKLVQDRHKEYQTYLQTQRH